MQRIKNLSFAGWGTVATIVATVLALLTFLVGIFGSIGSDSDSTFGSGSEVPGIEGFAENTIHNFFGGNYAAIWSSFHPAIKDLVSEERYVECEQQAGKPAFFLGLRFKAIQQESVAMEGVPPTASLLRYAVTAEVPEGKVTAPVDVMIVNEEQLSLLPLQWQYDAYANGTCPTPDLLAGDSSGRTGDRVTP